jgi:glycosyltransferase involved in cell wall biosynthesis
MKIGIFDPYLDDLGGGEKYMMSIAEYLSQKHLVEVFWDSQEDLKALSDRFSLDLSKLKLVPNVFGGNTSTIQRIFKTRGYDVIIVLSDGSIPTLFSKKLLIHFQQPLPGVAPSIKITLKAMGVKTFFCNSKYTKSFIDKEFNIKSKVLYPPVEIKYKNVQKENVIIHVGRFRVINNANDFKKQGIMVNAFKEMVSNGLLDWKFILAVSVKEKDKEAFEKIKKDAQGFPIEFMVNKSNDDLWDMYSKAKIYWHASGFGENLKIHPELAEHFGISTVEAMGAGVVPVVINGGGQVEIVEDGKNGLLWNSLDDLKTKTLKLIKDENLLSELSLGAIKSSAKFNKDYFYKGIDNLIA